MSNLTITNNDLGSPIFRDGKFKDELLVFGGAGTVLAGTLLARKAVADAITATADAGNTGDGTCTVASVVAGAIIPLVGDYNLECVEAITNGGRFKLEDPDGNLLSDQLLMTAGAGTATVFKLEGMTFTLTDGATDFIVGDLFLLTVAADGKMYPYVIAGLGGTQNPKAVLTYPVTATGAGNVAIRNLESGQVVKERLIIDADGDGSNITDAILDQLRDYTIVSQEVFELGIQDNQ